jgi:hypothetical protein
MKTICNAMLMSMLNLISLYTVIYMLFFTVSSRADITDSDKAYIDSKLNSLSQILTKNYNYLQSNVGRVDDYNYCVYNDACNEDHLNWPGAIYPPQGMIQDPIYGNQPVKLNDTVTKFPYGMIPSQTVINEVCFVNSQKNIWTLNSDLSRLNNSSNTSGVTWQYYGGDSGVSVFHPAFKWSETDTCPTTKTSDYNPKSRPWYVSATSAQKNIIIMIDLSDALHDSTGVRLQRMKQSTLLLLGSLSYRDFVGVIAYTEFSKPYIPQMMRAKMKNIDALTLYVNSLKVVPDSRANLADAFTGAYTMLANSVSSGLSSSCNNVFIILSTGSNDLTAVKPINVVKQSEFQNVTVFSNIYASNTSQGGILDLAEVSCFTNGNLLTVKTNDDADNVIVKFNEYMATATYNTIVRWSEPYDDELTGARITTGSLPIYVNDSSLRYAYGVVALDINVSTLMKVDQNLTETDVMNYLIAKQSCPALEVTPTFIKAVQSEETCKQNDANSQNAPDVVKNKGGIVTLTVLLAIILIASPYLVNIKDKTADTYCYMFFASLTMFFLCLWALLVFWVTLFPQIVVHENWLSSTFTTERIAENPYRCCSVVNCRNCEQFDGTSCNSLLSSLTEGACGNGYHCCQKYCYQCYCHTSCSSSSSGKSTSCSTYCSTCCTCTNSVSNLRCDTVCGTCYNPVTTLSFKDNQGQLTYGYSSTRCGLNDTNCLNSYKNSNGPIGRQRNGYYNPYNKNEVAFDISYKPTGIMAAFVIPMIGIGIIFIATVITLMNQWCTFCQNCDLDSVKLSAENFRTKQNTGSNDTTKNGTNDVTNDVTKNGQNCVTEMT